MTIQQTLPQFRSNSRAKPNIMVFYQAQTMSCSPFYLDQYVHAPQTSHAIRHSLGTHTYTHTVRCVVACDSSSHNRFKVMRPSACPAQCQAHVSATRSTATMTITHMHKQTRTLDHLIFPRCRTVERAPRQPEVVASPS